MKISASYSTSLPVLMKIVPMTAGDVCELGTGIFSTPVLHWMCIPRKRMLYSYENHKNFLGMFSIPRYEHDYHKIILLEDWDQAQLERPWSVVFIDHAPPERRKVDAARVANYAEYVIVHDSDGRNEKHYHYQDIYPLFKYLYTYKDTRPHTTILSNFVDLRGFSI